MQAAAQLVNRLLVDAQALAAFTSYLQVADSEDTPDPQVMTEVERVIDALDARAVADSLRPDDRAVLTNLAHSYLRQAIDLIENPARPAEWTLSDANVLQAQGTASGGVARLIAGAGLGKPDGRILDVGTGVAGIAIVFCELFPHATVVGIDPWEPALDLARANVTRAGLDGRITLRSVRIEDLEDPDGFDLVWLPSFFIPDAVLDSALERIHATTRPGADIVVGVSESTGDALTTAVDRLFTIRSGGSAINADQAREKLANAGFVEISEADTHGVPVRLLVGKRH